MPQIREKFAIIESTLLADLRMMAEARTARFRYCLSEAVSALIEERPS